jgi:hypothetical protein
VWLRCALEPCADWAKSEWTRRARSPPSKPSGKATSQVRFAGFVFDLGDCTLARESGEAILLTRGEFRLLRVFVRRPGRVLSRDAILEAVAKLYPGFTVQTWLGIHWSDDPTFNAQYQRIVEGLRKAGLPEQ